MEATFVGHFDEIEFPRPGSYFVQLWVNGRFICERRVTIVVGENGVAHD